MLLIILVGLWTVLITGTVLIAFGIGGRLARHTEIVERLIPFVALAVLSAIPTIAVGILLSRVSLTLALWIAVLFPIVMLPVYKIMKGCEFVLLATLLLILILLLAPSVEIIREKRQQLPSSPHQPTDRQDIG